MTHRGLVFLLAVTTSGAALAEADSQLWTSAGVRVRPMEDLRLDLSQELRFDQDISRTESVLTQLSTTWSIEKWFRVAGGYRFGREKTKNDRFETKHRLHLLGTLRRDLGPLTVSYRLWFQDELEPDEETIATLKVRNRVGAEYDTDTVVTPELTAEAFTLLADGRGPVQEKLRLTGGLEIRPDRSHAFDVFYRLQVPIDDTTDPFEHIIGLEYQYRLPEKK